MILVVDDDPDVHVIIRVAIRRLQRPELSLRFAADGDAGLAAISEAGAALDLVLSDVTMPRMDGHALLRAARGVGYTGPFVFIGAVASADHAATEWIDKDRLLEAIPELIARYTP